MSRASNGQRPRVVVLASGSTRSGRRATRFWSRAGAANLRRPVRAGSVMPMAGPFDRGDHAPPAGRRTASTCSWSAAASPAPASPSTPPSRGLRTALVERDDFASGTSSKSSKLVHGGLRYLQHGDVRLVYEALAERQRLRRNAPHLVQDPAVPHPDLHARTASIDPKIARALGQRDVDVRPHRRRPHRQAAQAARKARGARPHADAARATGSPAAYLYYDAQADDARLTLTIARTAALDSARSSPTGCRGRSGSLRTARTVGSRGAHGRRPTAQHFDVARPVRRQRRPACGPTTCARSTRARTPTRSVRPRASTSPCRGRRCATTSPWSCPVPKDKRSVFVVPWGRPRRAQFTYIGTTDTDYDGPLDDPQCTPEDVDYLLARDQRRRSTAQLTEDDVARHVGRAAPAGEERAESGRTADLSRRHQVRTLAERRRHGHRRQAHDLPRDGRRHRRRDRARPRRDAASTRPPRSRTTHLRLRGADGYDTRREAAPARRRDDRPICSTATAARPARCARSSTTDPTLGRAARARPALPAGRGGLRGAPRDGAHGRRRAVAPHPRPAARPATRPPAAADDGRRSCSRPSSAGTRRAARRSPPTAQVEHERTSAGCPRPRSRRRSA